MRQDNVKFHFRGNYFAEWFDDSVSSRDEIKKLNTLDHISHQCHVKAAVSRTLSIN